MAASSKTNPRIPNGAAMHASILLIGLLFFGAHAFSLLFERTSVPDVLLLMLVGIAAGPLLGLVSPEDFGGIGDVMSSIALVVILFEGGMTLNLATLGATIRRAFPLFLATFLGTAGLVAAAGMLSLGLPPLSAVIFGCVLGSISPAVVLPLARCLGLSKASNDILVVETSLTDVFSIILVFSLVSAPAGGGLEVGKMIGAMLSALVFAAAIGLAASFLWLKMLDFVRRFPNTMLSTLAFLFIVYGFTEFLGFSGAIASLAFGLGIANKPFAFLSRLGSRLDSRLDSPLATVSEAEMAFFNEMIFLLKTFFFVYLGISIRFAGLGSVGLGLGLTAALYCLRLLAVWSRPEAGFLKRDATFVSIMAPKGLASAVLAGLPLKAGLEGAQAMRDAAYMVIFFSIIATSLLVFLIKRGVLEGFYGRVLRRFPEAEAAAPGLAAGTAEAPDVAG